MSLRWPFSPRRPQHRAPVRHWWMAGAIVVAGLLSMARLAPGTAATTTSFYFSPDGSDANPCAPALPCKTLEKASGLPLNPGDALYLRRGGAWRGTLSLARSGASGANIIVGAYGAGTQPKISGGRDACVRLVGNRITLDNIETSSCGWSGVKVEGDNVIVKYVTSTGNVAGVFIGPTSDGGVYEHNWLAGNDRMNADTPGTDDDSGAFGFLVHGNRNELRWNYITGSDAKSADYGRDGCAVEIFGASNTMVHHNTAVNNNCFVELGRSSSGPAVDANRFEYNTIYSDERGTDTPKAGSQATALITRGDSNYGPVTNTKFRNNSVRLFGNGASPDQVTAVSCSGGCTSAHLELRANAIKVTGASSRTGWVNGGFANSDFNVYSPSLPTGLARGGFDIVADPMFVSDVNLRLRDDSSPAVDRGCTVYWTYDQDRLAVPVDVTGVDNGPTCPSDPDAGAFERHPVSQDQTNSATSGASAPAASTTGPRYDDLQPPGVAPYAAAVAWGHRDLTYAFATGTSDITGNNERQAVREAMALWSSVATVSFAEVATPAAADIVIGWATGDHGDGSAFDGQNGVLAHAFYPENGDIHFDDAELWTLSPRTDGAQPIDLMTVAAHEIGHSIGLGHSDRADALMFPLYGGSHRFLSPDDIAGIRDLYPSRQPRPDAGKADPAWVDFDGDTQVDYCRRIAASGTDGAGGRVSCTLSTGSGFGATITSGVTDWGYESGRAWSDFNGDGRADFCRRTGYDNLAHSTVSCTLSTGSGFGATVTSGVTDWGSST